MKSVAAVHRLKSVLAERLESRLLFYAFDPNLVHPLPYSLDFSSMQMGFEDAASNGTGLTRVQFNNAGNQYQPSLIQLDTTAGVLKLTTSGVAQTGANQDGSNSLINGLGAAFDAATTPFAVTTTLLGPMTYLKADPEQVGIMFGPDQDNYVKVTAVIQDGRGQIGFADEQTSVSGAITHVLPVSSGTIVGPFGLIGSLKLRLIGDPIPGIIQAQYSINDGNFVDLPGRLTLTGVKKSAFFSSKGIASILAIQNNSKAPVTYTFDDFSIQSGSRFSFQPSITSVIPADAATDLPLDASVTAVVTLPTPGTTIDASTLTPSNVQLVETGSGSIINANLSISGNSILLQPTANLLSNTQYTFSVGGGLKDSGGVAFQAFSSTFTTGIFISPGSIAASASRLLFNAVKGASSPTQDFIITNTGAPAQTITASGITLTGTDAGQFSFTATPGFPVTLTTGQTLTLKVKYTAPSGTVLGLKTADLSVRTEDAATPGLNVALRSLATSGAGGANEPSLQRILDLYQIPVTVGDSNPDDTFIDTPPITPNDEIPAQVLQKADPAQPVSIEPIAAFAVNTEPALRFGYYEPGTPDIRTLLWSVAKADAQSVNPAAVGTTSFDPGSGAFALLAIWPGFTNSDGSTREIYSEDALNTWEPTVANRHKMRFYPLKNADGSTVPHAYVIGNEEFTAGYDSNDVVVIVRNVQIAPVGPEIGLSNLDGVPYPDRLVFSRIQNPNTTIPNITHDVATIRIRNTGLGNLVINSVAVSSGWQVQGTNTFPKTLAPAGQNGDSFDLPIKFIATSGGLRTGTLTITSNDADEPTKTVALAGFWQQYSEATPSGTPVEPTLAQLISLFGYTTKLVNSGQNINTGGQALAVGDEVLSGYWTRADTSIPLTFRQLAAYHTQGNTATLKYFVKGTPATKTTIFTELGADSQSILPRSTASGNPPAFARLSNSSTLGFYVDNESSDDTVNLQEAPGGGWGHHIRFYPVKDRSGNAVANSYLLVMDYNGINYDYNDNVYLITNLTPATAAALPLEAPLISTSTTKFSMISISANDKDHQSVSALVDSVSPVL